jgi:hypothetical protein
MACFSVSAPSPKLMRMTLPRSDSQVVNEHDDGVLVDRGADYAELPFFCGRCLERELTFSNADCIGFLLPDRDHHSRLWPSTRTSPYRTCAGACSWTVNIRLTNNSVIAREPIIIGIPCSCGSFLSRRAVLCPPLLSIAKPDLAPGENWDPSRGQLSVPQRARRQVAKVSSRASTSLDLAVSDLRR